MRARVDERRAVVGAILGSVAGVCGGSQGPPLGDPAGFKTPTGRYSVARMREFAPSLHVAEASDGVRLTLHGITQATGPTLQDAADELVCKVLSIAMAFRSGNIAPPTWAVKLDPGVHKFIWELSLIAASGGDIRQRLFGPGRTFVDEKE